MVTNFPQAICKTKTEKHNNYINVNSKINVFIYYSPVVLIVGKWKQQNTMLVFKSLIERIQMSFQSLLESVRFLLISVWVTGLFIICTSVVQGYVWPLVGPSIMYIQQRVNIWRVIRSGLYITQTVDPLTTFKCWAIRQLDNYFYSMVTLTTFIMTIAWFNNQCDF